MTTTVRILHLKEFVREQGGWFNWIFREFLSRSFAWKGAIWVLAGSETDDKLMAHEFGHLIGLKHPGAGSGIWGQTKAAILEGYPIMSWTWVLRRNDEDGLVRMWQREEKVVVHGAC